MAISRDELLRLARAGATARIQELQAELDSIYRTFPDLKGGGGRRPARTASAPAAAPTRSTSTSRAKRAWGPADRRAVSERMKKYWAQRRAKGAKTSK